MAKLAPAGFMDFVTTPEIAEPAAVKLSTLHRESNREGLDKEGVIWKMISKGQIITWIFNTIDRRKEARPYLS